VRGWSDLGVIRSADVSNGKHAHNTVSQSKKIANIIAIDNHSEKATTENNYMPGFSIVYRDLISIHRILEQALLTTETSLIFSRFLDFGLGAHTLP
jgi:hypothetical protein